MTHQLLWMFDPVVITVEALQTARICGKVCAYDLQPSQAYA